VAFTPTETSTCSAWNYRKRISAHLPLRGQRIREGYLFLFSNRNPHPRSKAIESVTLFHEAVPRAISELAGNSSADINLISWLLDPSSKETQPRGYILSPVPRVFRWNLSCKYLGRKWRGSLPRSRHNAMDRYGQQEPFGKPNYLTRN